MVTRVENLFTAGMPKFSITIPKMAKKVVVEMTQLDIWLSFYGRNQTQSDVELLGIQSGNLPIPYRQLGFKILF